MKVEAALINYLDTKLTLFISIILLGLAPPGKISHNNSGYFLKIFWIVVGPHVSLFEKNETHCQTGPDGV